MSAKYFDYKFSNTLCTVIQLQAFATRWRIPLNMKICKCAELQWNENRERCRAIKIFLTREKASNICRYRYSPSGDECSKWYYRIYFVDLKTYKIVIYWSIDHYQS
uniref:Uncharacterized protein n=1 Tax=Trichogramma kaykai TaxID=54128 RepID=A0ABD2XBM2_9HYME